MRKLYPLIIVLSLVLTPLHVDVQAANFFLFDEGDVWLPNKAGNSAIHIDSQASYADTEYSVGQAPMGVVHDYFGNAYTINRTDNTISCVSPPNYTGSSDCPGTPPYAGPTTTPAFAMSNVAIDVDQNIWVTSFNGTSEDHTQIAQFTHESDYATVNLYTTNDSGNHGSALYIAIDHYGDVWVTNSQDSNGDGDSITCLDASNNYGYCTGPAFDSLGQIQVGTYPTDILVDENNDIWVASLVSATVTRLDRDQNFTQTTVASGIPFAWQLAMDDNGDVFVTRYGSNAIHCLDSSNSYAACSGFPTTRGPSLTVPDSVAALAIDANNDVWFVNTGDDQAYCLDSSNSYANCANTPIALSSFFDSGVPPTGAGDPTGRIFKRLFENSALEDDAVIYATVEPVLSFALSSSLCELSDLSATTIETCNISVTVNTNAPGGYTARVRETQELTDGTNSIDDTDGTIVAGTEEYGVASTQSGNDITQINDADSSTTYTSADCTTLDNQSGTNMTATALTSTDQAFASGNGVASAEETVLCIGASIGTATPAGAYSLQLRVTLTGNF